MSRISNSIERESRLVLAWSWGRWLREWLLMGAGLLADNENVPEVVVMVATLCDCIKNTGLYTFQGKFYGRCCISVKNRKMPCKSNSPWLVFAEGVCCIWGLFSLRQERSLGRVLERVSKAGEHPLNLLQAVRKTEWGWERELLLEPSKLISSTMSETKCLGFHSVLSTMTSLCQSLVPVTVRRGGGSLSWGKIKFYRSMLCSMGATRHGRLPRSWSHVIDISSAPVATR